MSEKMNQWLPDRSMSKADEAEAAERQAEIIEKGETKFYYLPAKDSQSEKPEILIGARDMGPVQSLLPVIQALAQKGYPLSFQVDQPAEKSLLEQVPDLEEIELSTPLAAIAERKPGLVLSSISGTGGPGIEFYQTVTAEGFGNSEEEHIPTVWVEDFWGVATQVSTLANHVQPDVICAFDEFSRDMDMLRLQDAESNTRSGSVHEPRIVVTGSPAFDALAHEPNREADTKRVRSELGITEHEMLIASLGGRPPKDLENLKLFVESMKQIDLGEKKVKITARIHPSVFGSGELSKYRGEYEKLLVDLGEIGYVDTMGKFTTDEIALAADMIVSSYGTEGVKAVYRGKISLFMLLPGLGADGLKEAVGMDTLPVIESGASIGVFRPEDMKEIHEAQARHHHLDGKNTERIVEAIESLLKNREQQLP